ncbi:MAG: DUF2382 domain-containing protein [Chloroflexota bacterium]|nr:DUF2382 domain-containing protein [Chloroflexota bacterium]
MTMGRSDYDQTRAGAYNHRDNLAAGADVYGSDNEKIGTVADVGQNYFLVQKGWLFIKDLYLPTSTIAQADGNDVYLNLTKQQAEQMGRDELPSADDAWYGTQRTGAATTGVAADTDYATGRTTDRMPERTTDREVGRDVRGNENVTVPVVEEQLKAGVREIEAGRARIVKDVREEQQTIDVPVEHEEVYVTERAADRSATREDLGMMDRDIEIPLREQEVVTQKEARVVGEVEVRKEMHRDTERVTDTVRREEVHVEDPNNSRVHVEGNLTADQRRRSDMMSATERERHDATNTTDTAYDRTGIAGDRTGRQGEGILDRAKDAVRDGEDKLRNR